MYFAFLDTCLYMCMYRHSTCHNRFWRVKVTNVWARGVDSHCLDDGPGRGISTEGQNPTLAFLFSHLSIFDQKVKLWY